MTHVVFLLLANFDLRPLIASIYLSLLLNFHFSPFPSYFKMQAAFFFSDFDIPIVCVCVFQFVFHVLTITRHVDLSSQTRDQIHTAGTENVVLNGPPEKS